MAFTYEQLGQKVKAQYPQYKDMSDEELGKLVASKYPQYQQQIKEGTGILSTIKDVGVGALKGLGSTAAGASELFQKGAAAIIPGGKTAADIKRPEALEKLLTPTTTAQKVGFGAEQIAEFLVPGLAATRLAKGAKVATTLGVKGLAKEAAKEATIGATVAAAQKGTVDTGVLTTGAISGAFPVIGAGIRAAKPVIKAGKELGAEGLLASARKNLEKVLHPTKAETKKISKEIVIPQLLKQPEVALTREGLETKLATQRKTVGEAIGEFGETGAIKGETPKTKLLDIFEQKKAQYVVPGKRGKVIVEPEKVKQIEELQDIVDEFDDIIPNSTLNQLRKAWAKTVYKGKQVRPSLIEGSALDLKDDAVGLMTDEIAKVNPDLAALNKQYHFLKGAEKVLKETQERKVGQTGVVKKGLAVLAGAALAPGESLLGKLLGAGGMRLLTNAVDSTAWNTVSAAAKSKLANALVKEEKSKAMEILKRIAKSVGAVGTATAKQQVASQSKD